MEILEVDFSDHEITSLDSMVRQGIGASRVDVILKALEHVQKNQERFIAEQI